MNKHRNQFRNTTASLLLFISAAALTVSANAEEVIDSIEQAVRALMAGKAHVHLRYRYEFVDDDLAPADNANASTLRAALGWETGKWNGLSLYGELEHVAHVFSDDFKEGPGPIDPTHVGTPVVSDPAGTELNQAYARFDGIEWAELKIGRQAQTYRKAPFHRFIGTVLWRQNWQTMDAVNLTIKPDDRIKLNYTYVNQVNRIFGDDAPGAFDRFNCDCHMVNAQAVAFPWLNVEVYGYLLDIKNAAVNSTDTIGIRASGSYPLNDKWKFIYAGEYANQDDSNGNPRDIDAAYYLGEAGFNIKLDSSLVKTITAKFDYELLEGDGSGAFITPLATGHAFQGWADRFLTTPHDGIEDMYFTVVAGGVFGGKLIFSYHMLESDNLSYDYGNEADILYTRKVKKYFTFGVKAALYDADGNATTLARSGAGAAQNNDVTKVWAWLQFDY